MKKITLTSSTEVTRYIASIMDAADTARGQLLELSKTQNGIQLLNVVFGQMEAILTLETGAG